MPQPTVEMEVERVMNLVRGFGWEKAKEEILGDEIHIEIKKKIPPDAQPPGTSVPS